jgi:hypothetical protein
MMGVRKPAIHPSVVPKQRQRLFPVTVVRRPLERGVEGLGARKVRNNIFFIVIFGFY